MTTTDWAVEALLQYVRSPMWTTPIGDFVDTNCIIFDGEDENKLEYTQVHAQFRQLIEGLLDGYAKELELDLVHVIDVLSKSTAKKTDAKQPLTQEDKVGRRFVEYITSLDDFVLFRNMMEKRNKELELAALEELKKIEGAGKLPPSQEQQQQEEGGAKELSTADQEEDELQEALRQSLADNEVALKAAELEDAELKHALALSISEEEARVGREKKKLDEERAAREAQQHQQQEQQHHQQEQQQQQEVAREEEAHRSAQIDQESAQRKHVIAEENLEERRKVAQKAVEIEQRSAVTPTTTTPPPQQTQQTQQQASAGPPEGVVHVSRTYGAPPPLQQQPSLGGLAPLGDVGGRKGGFGFKPLPQPSFKQLKSEAATSSSVQQQAPPPVVVASPASTASSGQQPSEEEVQRRAQYLREQREKILAKKRQERGEQLEAYQRENNLPTQEQQQQQQQEDHHGLDDVHKQMSVDLARRFRADLVSEAHKTQQ